MSEKELGKRCGASSVGPELAMDSRQALFHEVKIPVDAIETAPYLPDAITEYLDYTDKTTVFGRLYGIVQWIMGLDDQVDTIIIVGRNDRGERYKLKVVYEE